MGFLGTSGRDQSLHVVAGSHLEAGFTLNGILLVSTSAVVEFTSKLQPRTCTAEIVDELVSWPPPALLYLNHGRSQRRTENAPHSDPEQ